MFEGKAKGTSPKLDKWLEVTVCASASRVSVAGRTQAQHTSVAPGIPWSSTVLKTCHSKRTHRKEHEPGEQSIWQGFREGCQSLLWCRNQHQRHTWRGQTHIRLFKQRILQPFQIKPDTWDLCQNVCKAASPSACMLCSLRGKGAALLLTPGRMQLAHRLGRTLPSLCISTWLVLGLSPSPAPRLCFIHCLLPFLYTAFLTNYFPWYLKACCKIQSVSICVWLPACPSECQVWKQKVRFAC